MSSIQHLSEIKSLLAGKPKIVIVMHRGPDGDAIGSSLGWYHILDNLGISATVIAPDAYPDFLQWLPGNEKVLVYERDTEAAQKAIDACDVIFCLDFNAPGRMGKLSEVIENAGKTMVVVDHHQEPSDFAQAYYVDDTASSTAEMIYRLALDLGVKSNIGKSAAICLYTGIVTDTGSFRFSSVSPALMRIAADLMETGMDHTQVYRHVFDSNTEERLKLRGYALSEKMKVIKESGVAYISLTQEELVSHKFKKGDTEGLVNYALSIDGINVAAFFAEKDGMIKISLRSKGNFDVNQLSRKHFEGGGHVNAAGGKSDDSMEDTLKRFESIALEEAEAILASI